MLTCIAIDDEPLALRQLVAYIAKIGSLRLERTFTSAVEAQQYLAAHPTDLLFVDIEMPDLTGVELVQSLVRRPMVIFTTAYSQYAVQGYKLDAIDYLLKPFDFADFARAVSKAGALHELIAGASTAPVPAETTEYLSLKADYKTTLIRIADIVYAESEGEYVRLHLEGQPTVTTLYRLKNMESALPADRFMRVHRSYIINLQRIKGYVKGRVFLGENEQPTIPIGENYRETFSQYIQKTFE